MKRQIPTNTIQAGSWFARSDPDARSPLQQTMVAGSWPTGLDSKQTLLDARAATKTLALTPSRSAARSPLDAAAAATPLDRTMLLRPGPSLPNVNAVPASAGTPSTNGSKAPEQRAKRAFEIAIVENVTSEIRYRDAMRRRDDEAFVLMTDFARSSALPSDLLTAWRTSVRGAVIGGASPAVILALMNRELANVGLEATATCAKLDVRARRIVIASAGGPNSFVLHANERISRVPVVPSAALGRTSTSRFGDQLLPFGHDDTLLVPSSAWITTLERIFSAQPYVACRTLRYALRERRAQPAGGSLIRLTMFASN